MNVGYFVILFYVVTLGLSAWLISQVFRGLDDADEKLGKPTECNCRGTDGYCSTCGDRE